MDIEDMKKTMDEALEGVHKDERRIDEELNKLQGPTETLERFKKEIALLRSDRDFFTKQRNHLTILVQKMEDDIDKWRRDCVESKRRAAEVEHQLRSIQNAAQVIRSFLSEKE